jgi:hypothetical protein
MGKKYIATLIGIAVKDVLPAAASGLAAEHG